MLKLYGGARSRASIVQWYLEELGISYEFVLLDLAAGEHRQAEYLAINPMGKVPAIVDGNFLLWESGAILLYLAEKYGKMPSSLTEKSIVTQWVLFANSTLATGLFVEANREKEMLKLLTPLNKILSEQPFLQGNELTVADIAVGSVLAYAPIMLRIDFSDYPAIVNYLKCIAERPAFQKTIGKR
jgi:glutathione S-transferase